MTVHLHPEDGIWKPLTWRQTGDRAGKLANGLLALGLVPGEHVAIVSNTRVEWILADLAVLCAGGVTATVYAASTEEDTGFILADSKAAVAFAEDAVQAQKILKRRDELPDLRRIVVIDASGRPPSAMQCRSPTSRRSGARGRASHPGALEAAARDRAAPSTSRRSSTRPGRLARPKGVELPHDCWLFVAEAVDATGIIGPSGPAVLLAPPRPRLREDDRRPLLGSASPPPSTAASTRSSRTSPSQAHLRVRGPRIFEKVHARIVAGPRRGRVKAALFRWAVGVGQGSRSGRGAPARPGRRSTRWPTDWCSTRSAPSSAGGSSSSSRAGAARPRDRGVLRRDGGDDPEGTASPSPRRPPTATASARNRSARSDPDPRHRGEDRRGRRDPPARAPASCAATAAFPTQTAEALDADGWLHTGDVGHVDREALSITDRKKDLIKTSGGKYVAPQHVEGMPKLETPADQPCATHRQQSLICAASINLSRRRSGRGADGRAGGETLRRARAGPAGPEAVRPHVERREFRPRPSRDDQAGGDPLPELKIESVS